MKRLDSCSYNKVPPHLHEKELNQELKGMHIICQIFNHDWISNSEGLQTTHTIVYHLAFSKSQITMILLKSLTHFPTLTVNE